MADTPIVPIENVAPPAVETKPAAVEAPQESSKIDSSSVIEKKFERLAAQYEKEGRLDARDEAALRIIEDISALTDIMSDEMQKRFSEAPTMVIEVLKRIGLAAEQEEILSPLKSEERTLRNRLADVHNFTKQKLKALRNTERETREREGRKAVVPEVAPSVLEPKENKTGFEKMTSKQLKDVVAKYDKVLKKFEKDHLKAKEDLAKIEASNPDYQAASDKADNIYKQMLGFKKIKELAKATIGHKAEVEVEDPKAVIVDNAIETSEPVVATDSDSASMSETGAEVAEQTDAKTMLAFLKAFGLPKSEYTTKQLVAENFNDYKKVFEHVIGNWKSIPGSLRPPMLIVDSQGNKFPTFAKFAEALIDASPKEREKIKNSYIEFASVVGSGGTIGSLAGVELSGRNVSSGVNPETFFQSRKTTANTGTTRRSSIIPDTASAARPVEVARVAPVAEITPPIPPREEPPSVPEKMMPGKWSGLLEKGGRRVENVSTTVEKALKELPVLGRLEFGTQSEGNSLVVEKLADGKYKLTGIEGGETVEKGVVKNLDFKPESDGSFFGLTWAGGEYLNVREFRSLVAEVVKPVAIEVESKDEVLKNEIEVALTRLKQIYKKRVADGLASPRLLEGFEEMKARNDRENIFYNLIKGIYNEKRAAYYPLDEDVYDKAWERATEDSSLSHKERDGWVYRGNFSEKGKPTVARGSLNITIDENVISELDALIKNGVIDANYKFGESRTSAAADSRHDAISLYFLQEPTPEALSALSGLAKKYYRGDNLLGRKISEGFYMSEIGSIKDEHAKDLAERLKSFDPKLAKEVDSELVHNRGLIGKNERYAMSEAQFYAVKEALNIFGFDINYDNDKGFEILKKVEPTPAVVTGPDKASVSEKTSEEKIMGEYRKSKGSELQKLSFELDVEMKKDPDNEELKLKRKVLDQVLGEKYKELVKSFIESHKGDPLHKLTERLAYLMRTSEDLKTKLNRDRNLGNLVVEIKSALAKSLAELDAVETLFHKSPPVSTTETVVVPPTSVSGTEKPADSTVSAEPVGSVETAKDEAAILAEYKENNILSLQNISPILEASLKERPDDVELILRKCLITPFEV